MKKQHGVVRRPKRTEVSVRSETYERLKEEAEKRGIRVTELVEMILTDDTK